jgi:hypothetical protein
MVCRQAIAMPLPTNGMHTKLRARSMRPRSTALPPAGKSLGCAHVKDHRREGGQTVGCRFIRTTGHPLFGRKVKTSHGAGRGALAGIVRQPMGRQPGPIITFREHRNRLGAVRFGPRSFSLIVYLSLPSFSLGVSYLITRQCAVNLLLDACQLAKEALLLLIRNGSKQTDRHTDGTQQKGAARHNQTAKLRL